MIKTTGNGLDWPKVLKASQHFGADLYLVSASATPKVSPLAAPWMPGRYSLTDFSLTDEPAFLKHYGGGREVALLVGCMDQRFARPLYNWAVDTNPRLFILPVFVAAGICQSGDPNRLQAMRVIAQYCLEKLNVKKVIASGHNCGCGGVAHIMFKGQKVYEALKCAAGDKKENTYMQNAISVSVNEIFDRQQRRIVQKVLVAQSGEKINFVTFR